MSVTFKLQDFEGPLDLLLYLIEKNKMSIYDIEISAITNQYMEYLEDSAFIELEQLSDFIVMAANLILIKSKMLLPKSSKFEEGSEEDPREELVRKLLEYKKIKYVSSKLIEYQSLSHSCCFRNVAAHIDIPEIAVDCNEILEDVTLQTLYYTFQELIKQKDWDVRERSERKIDHSILRKDVYTIEQKSIYILQLIILNQRTSFFEICRPEMPKIELIVTFMALLELVHKKKVVIIQEDLRGDIVIIGGQEDE